MLSMQSSPGAHSASDEFSGLVSQGPPGVQSFPSTSKPGHYPHQDPEHQDEQGQQPRQQQPPPGVATTRTRTGQRHITAARNPTTSSKLFTLRLRRLSPQN